MAHEVNLVLAEANAELARRWNDMIAKTPGLHLLFTAASAAALLEGLRPPAPQPPPRPNLLLLSQDLPGSQGWALLESLKGDPQWRQVPVVILGIGEELDQVRAAYAAGACCYIRKPLGPRELQTVVERLALYWGQTVEVPQHLV